MTLADRIVVMRAGEIVQVGTPMEIYSDPASYFVADFFGSPSMNLLAGDRGTNGTGRFRGAGRARRTASSRAGRGGHARHPAGARRRHARRQWRHRASGPAGRAARRDTLLYFDAGTERAFVAVSEGLDMADVKVGARMALSLDPRRLYLFGADGGRLAPS